MTDRAAYVLNSWSPSQQNLNHVNYIRLSLYNIKKVIFISNINQNFYDFR